MYVYESSATEEVSPLHGVWRVSVRSAVCQKNNNSKSSIKHHLMNTCARCVVCPRLFVLLYGRRTLVKVRFPQASFYEHVCHCVVCLLFFVVFYHVLLLYHAHAITYILYVVYSSYFVVRGSEQLVGDTLKIYTGT